MKKPMTNDAILDVIYDIADARGMRIDDFLELLQSDYADSRVAYDDGTLPPEVVEELNSARALRREIRESKRKADEDASLKADIAAFRELFPDVKTDEIPKTVWDEVSGGTDLRHAYALYALTNRAEQANRERCGGERRDRQHRAVLHARADRADVRARHREKLRQRRPLHEKLAVKRA